VRSLLADDVQRAQMMRVLGALDRRKALPGGAAREKLDRSLIEALANLKGQVHTGPAPGHRPPPRPIAVAMALTLFAQPHLVATFARPPANRDHRPILQPVLVPLDVMSELLALERWELEELQGEIDRRVGLHLKQHRAISWLWAHFGLPKAGVSALVHVLFPGLQDVGKSRLGLSRRGGQLYALVDQHRPPRPSSLYLGWVEQDLQGGFSPRGTFAARYVDKSLRQTLCRCIGSVDEELVELLERMVTVVPRGHAPRFLSLDRWRSAAFDAITGLAGPYPRSSRLTAPLLPDDVPFEGFLRKDGDDVRIDNPKALFDSVALDRVTEASRQLHAHGLATIVAQAEQQDLDHQVHELVRYDVRRHLTAVLDPVMRWPSDPATVDRIARRMGVEPSRAASALDAMARVWQDHRERTWIGPTDGSRPDSVAVRLTAQLIRTRHALGSLWNANAVFEHEHREAALLFAAFYFAEAPLDRLWGRDTDNLGEDPVGAWFFPTWWKLLEHQEPDSVSGTFQF